MVDFKAKSLCILGRQSTLGLAELESLYGAEHIRPITGAALLDIPAEDIDFKRLGGTIKVARILAVLPETDWKSISEFMKEQIPAHLANSPAGKFTLGISVYGLNVQLSDLNKTALGLKKIIKSSGRPVRVVPNKNLELNSAQVLHNKLTHAGAWELLLVRDEGQTIVAQTMFVQDIEAYASRDQARPARDARVGMLPPKLAQIIINLATGPLEQVRAVRVLDPFCGTGVILQESLLMGYSAYGTDIESRMVEYSKQNIGWLRDNSPRDLPDFEAEVGDATDYRWNTDFQAVASELYLGRALSQLPGQSELKEIINDTNTIIKKFLANIAPQLKPGTKLCLAVPAWRISQDQFLHLPLIDHLTDMGYNYLDLEHVRSNDLIYYRKDQTVARQLIRLGKQ